MPDLERLDADRRERLLRATAAEIARRGIEHASLNRVMAAVGMSKSSFYHHVGSREALVDAVLDELGRRLVERIAPPTHEALRADFWGELHGVAERLLEAGDDDPVFWQLGRLWHDRPASDHPGPASAGHLHRWLTGVLLVGRDTHDVRRDLPVDLQARMTLAVISSLDAWAVQTTPAAARALLPAQLAALHRLLRPAT